MKVTVNKCPYTGQLFESDRKYNNHLAVLRRERAALRAAQKLKDDFFSWLDSEKEKITQIDMIIPWIYDNQRTLMDACNSGLRCRRGSMGGGWGRKFYATDKHVDLNLSSLRYSESVSNTHTCPNNGVMNWGGRVEGAPRGYPGWTGRLEGSTIRDPKHMGEYPTTDMINLIDIKTGTGGGGNNRWGYHVDIFLADWPGLQHEVDIMEQDRIVSRLKGKP